MKFDIGSFRNKPLPTESEIKARWKNMVPVVTVICTTYNQENYIDDAIRGFLIQETDFAFEIIIHDDASTDRTRDIVQGYKSRYPDLIRLIVQNINQYSQGKQILSLVSAYAIAAYVAICEGDDFWIDANKLQIQMALLLEHPGIDICFHPVKTIVNDGVVLDSKNGLNLPVIVKLTDVVAGGGNFMPTASLIVKTAVVSGMSPWFHTMPIGDYFIQVYGSLNGALFVPQELAAYRLLAANSWTSRMKSNVRLRIANEKKILLGVSCLNKEVGSRFNISKSIDKMRASILLNIIHVSIANRDYEGFFDAFRLGALRLGPQLFISLASRFYLKFTQF